jgi:acyl-CoA thioester hydrolase
MKSGVTSVRVRYPETDQMGVVHHSHFLVWFELGRTELLREAGCPYADLEREGVWMPVVEASCRYLSPARYDEVLEVSTSLAQMGRATARFEYAIRRTSDGRTLATGATRHAATDARGVPCRMPDRLLALLGCEEA